MKQQGSGGPTDYIIEGSALSSSPVMATEAEHGRSGRGRLAALGALVLVAVIALFLVTRGHTYHYEIAFENSGQLVRGDLVRVGGTPAGTVTHIGLTDDGQAEITIKVSDEFGPFRQGTTATIRHQGLVSIAGRFVDISPAPTFKPALPDGGRLAADDTTSFVEVDQFFNTFTPATRTGLRHLVKGFADWYQGNEPRANVSAKYFGPSLEAATRLFSEINRDSATFQEFLAQTGKALGDLTQHRGELTALVSNTRTTLGALSVHNKALSEAVQQLPRAFRAGSDSFVALRPTLDDLQRLVAASGPSTRDLAPFMRELTPVLERARPTFHDFRVLFDRPGAHDDLYDGLRDLPQLAQLIRTTFPHARKGLRDSTPMFSFARPYIPDLMSFVGAFGGTFATYDANGHYARTLPVFDAFSFKDDSSGGSLVPKAPSARGRSADLQSEMLRRCPGAAGRSAPDGSGPWVDNGPLANPDCDPSQTPGVAR